MCGLTIAMGAARSQTGSLPAAVPQFEVASVKPGGRFAWTGPDRAGGRIRWTAQLGYLIAYAYNIDIMRLEGSHLGAIYALEATFDPAATDEQVRLMVRSLLADRFKMRVHSVTEEVEGYALTVGKGGLKIMEAKEGGPPPPVPEWITDVSAAMNAQGYVSAMIPEPDVAAIVGRRASMSKLAWGLERTTGKPVWDQTGLSGDYYFGFRYAQSLSDVDSTVQYPLLETALHNLGLEIKKQKGPIEKLVVDHFEAPSEN